MTTYAIEGLHCDGCVKSVTRAVERGIPGTKVVVDLAGGKADIQGSNDEAAIRKAVESAGFKFVGPVAA
ncbi:MAG: heavy-metal-associated domain-containing protein [Alphaproteobacteria bacterium]|nr:heavy-metal-associated domain-containing protein [Alphaproteobacteria bacterium]